MKSTPLFVPLVPVLALALFLQPASQALSETPSNAGKNGAKVATTAGQETLVYSAKPFLELVGKYASEGGEKVDYEAWKDSPEDLAVLDNQVAMIGRLSPVNHPELFPTKAAQRSYWINTYNTLVLQAVLEYWPLESVRDVKISASSRLVPGKGFFYDRKVVVGGDETNLYKLEKEVLRTQKDPRLHFALNLPRVNSSIVRRMSR